MARAQPSIKLLPKEEHSDVGSQAGAPATSQMQQTPLSTSAQERLQNSPMQTESSLTQVGALTLPLPCCPPGPVAHHHPKDAAGGHDLAAASDLPAPHCGAAQVRDLLQADLTLCG